MYFVWYAGEPKIDHRFDKQEEEEIDYVLKIPSLTETC